MTSMGLEALVSMVEARDMQRRQAEAAAKRAQAQQAQQGGQQGGQQGAQGGQQPGQQGVQGAQGAQGCGSGAQPTQGIGATGGAQRPQPQLTPRELGEQFKNNHAAGQEWQGFKSADCKDTKDGASGLDKAARDDFYQRLGGGVANEAKAGTEAKAARPVDPADAAVEATRARDATRPGKVADKAADPAAEKPADKDRGTGTNRTFRGFREISEAKLKEQLPDNAKHLAKSFIDAGKKHDIDPVMLAAISKHETGNFTSSAFKNKNNAMGISNRKGPVRMSSAEASIDKMAKGLADPNGYYRNAQTVGDLAKIYAPKGAANDPTGLNGHWPRGVSKYADQLERAVRS